MDGGPARAYSIAMVPLRLRAIALVAAYAVALQGLLSAFAPAAVAARADFAVLCSQQAAGETDQSGDHDRRLCATACVMHGAAAAPMPPVVAVPAFIVQAAGVTVSDSGPLKPLWRSAQAARAPPSV